MKFLKYNFISLRTLRSYTGRANHVANQPFGWQLFLDSLWVAVGGDTFRYRGKLRCKLKGKQRSRRTKAPRGMVWTKQVATSLLWIRGFLSLQRWPLTRSCIKAGREGPRAQNWRQCGPTSMGVFGHLGCSRYMDAHVGQEELRAQDQKR